MSAGKEFTYGLSLQVKGAEQVSSAQRLLDQFYASLTKGVGEITKFSQGFSRGTQEVATSTQKLSTSSNTLKTAIDQQKTAFQGVQQVQTQYKTTTDQTVQSQTRLGQATQQLQNSFNQEKSALMGATQSTQQLKTTTDQMVTSQTKIGTTLQQNTQQMNTYKTSQQQAVAGQQQFNTAAATSVSTMDRLKGSFSTLTLGVTTLTTGVFNLYNTYDNLNDQQLKLDTMEQKLARNKKMLSEAEEKYNKLLKDGKASQDDIADALRDVGLAQDRVRLSSEKLVDAQEDLDRAWKDFYINVLPAAVQTLGGGAAAIGTFAGAMKGVKPAADTAKAGLSGIAPAAGAAATGMTAVAGGGSRLIPILGGVGAAIAVVGGTLLAVNQNFGGFRDVMNNLGEAIGTAVPQLEGILNVIKGFAGQIGLSGEATREWETALKEGVETVTDQFETLKQMAIPVLNAVETALNEIGFAAETWIGNVQKVIGVYQDMANSVSKFVSDVQTSWNNLVSGAQTLGTQIKSAIDTGLAFLTNPATYTGAFQGLLDSAVEAGQNAVSILTSIINGIGAFIFGSTVWNDLVLGAQSAAKSAAKVIQDTLAGVQSWFDTYIGKPAAQAAGTIAKAAGDLTPKPADDSYQQYLKDTKAYQDSLVRAPTTNQIAPGGTPVLQNMPPKPQTGPSTTGTAGQQFPTAKPQSTVPMGSGTAGVQGPAQQYKSLQTVYAELAKSADTAAASQENLSNKVGIGTKFFDLFRGSADKSSASMKESAAGAGVAASATGQLTKAQADVIAGYQEQDAVLTKAGETLNKTAGATTRLKEQLADGGIQAVAFAQGFKEAENSFLNLQVSTSKVSGEVAFLSKNLGDAQGIAVRTAAGFMSGAKSVLEWAGSFDTMKGTMAGSKVALMDVANTMGVEIPAGFAGGTEALKEFISYSKQAGPEFESLMNTIQSAADQTVGGLGEALRKGNKEFGDEIEKLEEEWGFKFNNALENALEGQAGPKAIGSLVDSLSEAIKTVGPAISDPGVWDAIKSGFEGQIKETFEDFAENGGENAEAAIQAIIAKLNEPLDTNDPLAIQKRIGELQAMIVSLENQGATSASAFASSMDTINGITFDDFIAQVEKVKDEVLGAGGLVDQVKDAMQSFNLEETATPVGFDPSLGSPDPNSDPTKSGGGGGGGTSSKTGTAGKSKKGSPLAQGTGAGLTQLVDPSAVNENLEAIRGMFAEFMANIIADAAGIPNGIAAQIATLPGLVQPYWTQMQTDFSTLFLQPVVQQALETLGPGIAAGFDSARAPVEATLTAIRDAAAGTFTVIISDAQGLGPGIAAGFAAGRTQSAPHISGLAEDFAANAVVPIETMSDGLAETIGQAFEDGGARAETALGGIQTAADAARTAVEAIGTAVNNLPDQKTITIDIVTNGSVPSGLASGYEGIVNNPVQFTAGEAGPELVSVIPLTRPFQGPGSGGRNFGHDGITRIAAAEGFQGIVGGGGGTADFATYRHGNLTGQSPQTVTINDVNIAMVGGRPVSSVGGVLGGIPVTIVSGNSGFVTNGGITGGFGIPSGGGNGSGGGGGTGGGGSGGGGQTGGSNIQRQIDVMENGQRLFYYQNGSDIRTNMNAEQISRYVGSGAGPGTSPTTPNNPPPTGGTGGGGSGGGGGGGPPPTPVPTGGTIKPGGWGAGGWYEDWEVVPMRNDPSKFKIIDISDGKNVATDFNSEAEAQAWIDWYVANPEYRPPGTVYAAEGVNIPNAGTIESLPKQTSPPTSGSGGGSGGTGGGTGGGTTTDYSHVQTSGSGSRWEGAQDWTEAETFRVVPMQDDPNKWKVVDSNGKNIATNFNSSAEADTWIDEVAMNEGTGTGGGAGGGGGTPTTPNSPPTGGTGGIQISPGAQPYRGSEIVPSSDGNLHTRRGTTYTVDQWNSLDDDSRYDIAEDPTLGISSIPSGYHLNEDYSLSPIGGTGGQTGGSGIRPPRGDYGATGSPVPAGVKVSGTGSKWQGDPGDPADWEVVPMVDADKAGLWKVINGANGRNIATEFTSKEQAEEWLFTYQDGPNLPPPSGGNNQGPGTGGTPGGTGGTGSGVVQIRVQENGQTLFYERDASGAVRTNMSAAQIAQYVGSGAPGPSTGGGGTGGTGGGGGTGGTGGGPNIGGVQFPPGFPFGPDTPRGPGGGPIIGGIEFPPGFPFHSTPGAFPGTGGGGLYPGLLAGMGLPYSMISPRVTTDTSIPTNFNGYMSGSGYIGTEAGAGGSGRTGRIPGGVGVPFGWPFSGSGLNIHNGVVGANPNQGTTTITNGGITQTQSWNQSSNIVSPGSIVGRGNNINFQNQTNFGNNVGGLGLGGLFPTTAGSGSLGYGTGTTGRPQYYDSMVVENAEGTERHPEFRTNMNQSEMVRLLAMMEASGQEVPYYTSGEPALTGFRYNSAGWTGSRPMATPRQLRTGRDNNTPIWDVGRQAFPSDVGMRGGAPGGITGQIGGGNPFDWLGGLSGLIDKLTSNILSALQGALAKMAININLNNTSIGDAQTRLMMRRIGSQF